MFNFEDTDQNFEIESFVSEQPEVEIDLDFSDVQDSIDWKSKMT